MKNYIYKIFFLLTILGLSSCESDKDFLTENPETFYTLDNAFTSSSQVDQVLISCYNQIRSLTQSSNAVARILKGLSTDFSDVPARRVSTSFSDYSQLSAQTSEYNSIYSAYYQLISKANTALYAAELETISWTSDEEKSYAIAQAKFFRGLCLPQPG